jgi:hypothetical protein
MTRAKPPTLRFLFAHPAHFLALGFGAGLSPVAPGTFGTLVALPLAALLRAYANDAAYLAAVAAAFVAGMGGGAPGVTLASAITGLSCGMRSLRFSWSSFCRVDCWRGVRVPALPIVHIVKPPQRVSSIANGTVASA